MPKPSRKRPLPRKGKDRPPSPPPAPPPLELRSDRRPPIPDEEIVARLNELLEAERAGVEAAGVLQRADRKGVTDTELKKFAEDEASACAGLHRAILRYGGQPSAQTGEFGRKVAALTTEGERLNLMARGQAWVAKRLDVLLGMPLDEETRTFLAEMREEHLENVDACNRRAEELSAPPSPPYRDLEFAGLRESHDRLYYGAWRGPNATDRDHQRAYFQLGRYLGVLADEVQRARSVEARGYLTKARKAYTAADPATHGEAALRSLDNALSYAHSALSALLRHYRAPAHDPREFESFYDVVAVPFQDLA
jgi:hypothetical protein